MTNRRRFLRNMLVAGGSLSALGGISGIARLVRAGPTDYPHHHYVFAYFSGGWDVLLGLDPRDPNDFNAEDDAIEPGYELLPTGYQDLVRAGGMELGPYIGQLSTHTDRLAIIRGMSMETLTHEVGRRRFLTGKPPAGLQARGSSVATWISSRLGADDAIPHLSVGVETYNVDQPTYASALRVGSSTDLKSLLTAGAPALEDAQDDILQAFLANEATCERSRHSPMLRAAEGARLRLGGMLDANLASLFDVRNLDAALRARFGVASANDTSTPAVQALIAFQALTHEVSRCVSIQATSGLDTHFSEWARDHGPRQMAGYDAIASLVTALGETAYAPTGFTADGTTWLDHTTIIGFSEFSRTPVINVRGGRDHWLGNSCFLIGGNVRGGVIGASSDVGMQPSPVNLETGLVDPGGQVIRPEHVLRTLLVDAGITDDEADLRVDPIRALIPV
jgi:hypothetical protein